jgi:hypothetical protein
MSFYNDRILPHLINLSMRNREFLLYRERVLSSAQGVSSRSESAPA